MMRRRTAVAAAVLVCAAATSLAQDTDAETRFHRAYEHEVVDGKVADAAREYLAMMGDEKVPERLRLEAKFRFAVTTMLLGRADEARVHFGEIARDAKAPETLRARATEYLDAAKGVGVGNEIDRKMQELVFELAKDKDPVPAAYREFEVIGRRAVPFLRQLLQHDDAAIRAHAFRILLRMREPGMCNSWAPALTPDARAQNDLHSYLAASADELAAFRRRMLALDDEALRRTLTEQVYFRPEYDADTLRAFAARKVPPKTLLFWFPEAPTVETERVRGEWIRSDDADLSAEATLSYLAFVRSLPETNVALRTDLVPAIIARLERLPLVARGLYGLGRTQTVATTSIVSDGLARLTASMPAESILDALARTVEHGAAAPWDDTNPLKSGLVNALAMALERRDPQAELPARFGEVLKAWATAAASKQGAGEVSGLGGHVAHATSRVPLDAATALATWAVATAPKGLGREAFLEGVPTGRPRDVQVWMAALRAADPELRRSLIGATQIYNRAVTSDLQPAFVSEAVRALPEVVRLWLETATLQDWPPVASFVSYVRVLPVEEARDRFIELAEAIAGMPDPKRRAEWLTNSLFGAPAPNREDRTAYWADVAFPALDRLWAKLDATSRELILYNTLQLLEQGPRDPRLRSAIAQFVAPRYGEVPARAASYLAKSPDVFPLTEWVPRVCPDRGVSDGSIRVPTDRANQAVREMTEDAATVGPAVLWFAVYTASGEVQTEMFDRLLRTAPVERLGMVIELPGGPTENAGQCRRIASPAALEDGLGRILAAEQPDVQTVGRLCLALQTRKPSERLFPGVRLLLASPEPQFVSWGVQLAQGLGRDELLPDLARLLDSMDVNVRVGAKSAIDSIVALRKLKDEARRGAK